MFKRYLIITLFLLFLVGCASPAMEPVLGDVQVSESFDEVAAWESFEDTNISLLVQDGAYHIKVDDQGYIWGLNDQAHTDVVIEVTASQLSSFENNGYGVMCRADTANNGDGYYFLVSGDGYYSIRRGTGDDVVEIIDWTSHGAINKGTASNKIKAVCIGDYLAIYINDKFIAETNDLTYSDGYTGFAAATFESGNTEVAFDNLTIWNASAPATE